MAVDLDASKLPRCPSGVCRRDHDREGVGLSAGDQVGESSPFDMDTQSCLMQALGVFIPLPTSTCPGDVLDCDDALLRPLRLMFTQVKKPSFWSDGQYILYHQGNFYALRVTASYYTIYDHKATISPCRSHELVKADKAMFYKITQRGWRVRCPPLINVTCCCRDKLAKSPLDTFSLHKAIDTNGVESG